MRIVSMKSAIIFKYRKVIFHEIWNFIEKKQICSFTDLATQKLAFLGPFLRHFGHLNIKSDVFTV